MLEETVGDTMIGTPIAFGLTMVVCFTLFYYYWRIRQLRARLLAVQSTAPPPDVDFPVELGIGKNVVETFPTIKACELKCTALEDLQCPICLVEYEEWEVLRQLPFCGHIFHTLCVGAWFEKQTTCPVCRMSMSELTESFGADDTVSWHGPRSSDAALQDNVDDTEAPSWIRINRRLPLPAPPSPEPPPTESSAQTCTCSPRPGHGSNDTTSQAKPSGCTDFHVVNVQEQELRHSACSICKCTAKPVVKSVPSENSDVQILIFQTSFMASEPIRLDVERFLSEGVARETCGSLEPTLLQAAGSTSSGCELVASSNCGGPRQDPEGELQPPQGSFEFQPLLTESGEFSFRAMAL